MFSVASFLLRAQCGSRALRASCSCRTPVPSDLLANHEPRVGRDNRQAAAGQVLHGETTEPRRQLGDELFPGIHSFFSLLEAKVEFAKRVWGER